jgi:hypothetical protein
MARTGARAAAVARPDAAASPATSRAGWMDNLRVAVIAGVIILHAATAYILDVDWYYQERTTSTLTPLLLVFPALLGGLFGWAPCSCSAGCWRPRRWPTRAPAASPAAAWSAWACPCWRSLSCSTHSPTTSARSPRVTTPGSGPTWPTKPGLETPGRYGS